MKNTVIVAATGCLALIGATLFFVWNSEPGRSALDASAPVAGAVGDAVRPAGPDQPASLEKAASIVHDHSGSPKNPLPSVTAPATPVIAAGAAPRRPAVTLPSERSLIRTRQLDTNLAFGALASPELERLLQSWQSVTDPQVRAIGEDYRRGLELTLPPNGAALTIFGCGTQLCALEAMFPDEASAHAWRRRAFGDAGMPAGYAQVNYAEPTASGYRIRWLFSIDPRLSTLVPPRG